jgi:hypothetical protein
MNGDMVGGAIESIVVVVLNIWNTLIPCTQMLRFIHVQDVHNHLINDLYLAIGVRVEGSGFSELGVQQSPETQPKCVEETNVLIGDDDLWYPKMNPHSFEEELGSICCCDSLLAGYENGHLWKSINHHKYSIIALLGGWKDRYLIHRDGFLRRLRSRKRGV